MEGKNNSDDPERGGLETEDVDDVQLGRVSGQRISITVEVDPVGKGTPDTRTEESPVWRWGQVTHVVPEETGGRPTKT